MKEKLRRGGIRSVDAIVDVTNYVLLELGHPMHAFDLAEIDKGIVVRYANKDEKLVLLNGNEVKLDEKTLVIADQQKALAIAGIMGGEKSGVTASTKDIFLESAFFSPLAITGKAREYGLHTEASVCKPYSRALPVIANGEKNADSRKISFVDAVTPDFSPPIIPAIANAFC